MESTDDNVDVNENEDDIEEDIPNGMTGNKSVQRVTSGDEKG